ncbi:HD domain-containing protein [Solibacillus sp. FSL H8-0538]|uniref:HD domain-containing protein n=1 Tax=Solibacillus sp. FSL H8-0538 TaxID=2921400 RepID=UPI0030F9A5E6
MDLVDKAIQFIAEKHEGQYRKGLNVPHSTHLFGVARILKIAGYAEPVVIAGLLHDVLEDTTATEQELQEKFGDSVLALVKASTELEKSLSWNERKEYVIQQIKHKTDEQLAIMLAEKLHNVKSITVEVAQLGNETWNNFNAPKEKQEWYYRAIISEVKKYHPGALLFPQLELAVDKLFIRVENCKKR